MREQILEELGMARDSETCFQPGSFAKIRGLFDEADEGETSRDDEAVIVPMKRQIFNIVSIVMVRAAQS